MNEIDIAVKLENHDQEIKSLKHRVDEVEDQGKSLHDLAMSVQRLALNMEAMIKEQSKQGERISKLEAEPADRWKDIKKTALTSVVSTIAGAVAVVIILLIANYL